VGVHKFQALRAPPLHLSAGRRHCSVGPTITSLTSPTGRSVLPGKTSARRRKSHVPPGTHLADDLRGRSAVVNLRVIFPEYALPESRPPMDISPPERRAGHASADGILHRAQWAFPDARVLPVTAFTPLYGPNRGQGLGRVVRVNPPGHTFGLSYFIR